MYLEALSSSLLSVNLCTDHMIVFEEQFYVKEMGVCSDFSVCGQPLNLKVKHPVPWSRLLWWIPR